MARTRPHLTGIGSAVVLAFVMAGDLSGRAETAAPGGIAARPKEKAAEKVPEKIAEKTPDKGPAKTLPGGPNRIPLPRARPQPAMGAGAPIKTASLGPAAAAPAAPIAAPPAASLGISAADLAALKEAITLARNSKTGQVTD